MTRSVLVELNLPQDWKRFRLPAALHDRLQELLDRQDRDGKLSRRERREAEALVELTDILALMKLRAKRALSCSLRKAARTKARDPRTGTLVPLYHPRTHQWDDHFARSPSWLIRGKTPIGRATVIALKMNRPAIVAIRQLLGSVGKFPPRRRAPK
jgi:hypothetical protein